MTKPIFSLLLALMLLAGCGQKGSLYLENDGLDAQSDANAEDTQENSETQEEQEEETDSATTSE